MATINAQLNAPNGAGGFDVIQPQTNLNMINDMSAFMRLLNVAADATAARNQLGVKELTPQNMYAAFHSYGVNYVPADVSNNGWNALGLCSIYYTENNKIKNQPTQYGQLINIPAAQYTESTQIWIEQPGGSIYTRGGNGMANINDTPFSLISGQGFVAQSLQQNGWVKAANGLIIQWVTSTVETDTIKTITLPIQFTNWYIVLATASSIYQGNGINQGIIAARPINLTSFQIGNDNYTSSVTALLVGV